MVVDNLHNLHRYAMQSNNEKIYLHNFAQNLNDGSLVLEIGTNKGGSTAILANANSKINIHSIDLYSSNEFSYEENSNNLSCFDNVSLYKGNSFEDFKTWTAKLDVYFEDGAHENPALKKSMEQWIPLLRIGGFMLVHDNNLHFPDVGNNINHCVSTGQFRMIEQIDSLSVLQKVE